jgi:hypothetical protein
LRKVKRLTRRERCEDRKNKVEEANRNRKGDVGNRRKLDADLKKKIDFNKIEGRNNTGKDRNRKRYRDKGRGKN